MDKLYLSLLTALILIASFNVLLTLRRWLLTARLLGPRMLAYAPRLLSFVLYTPLAARLVLFSGAVTLLLLAYLQTLSMNDPTIAEQYWFWTKLPILLFTLITVHEIVYQATPPVVLLVSTSTAMAAHLREHMARRLQPYRVVALIDTSVATGALSSAAFNRFRSNNMSVRDSSNWKPVAYGLAEMVPFVILDTRIPSRSVVEEIQHILQPELVGKAIFLTGEFGNAPALLAAGVPLPNRQLVLVTEANLLLLLENLGLAKHMPVTM